VISAIRTPSLYPIAEYAEKIAKKIIETFEDPALTEVPVELVFNDVKLMQKGAKDTADEGDEPAVEIDDLLHDGDDEVDDLDDIDVMGDIEDVDDLDNVEDMDDLDGPDEE